LHTQCLIVRVGIPVVCAVREHEVDDAQHFVSQGDDGAFVPSANDETLELGA
jgi:ribosomal protein S12 methylthiotransferase accessory factor YcaO